MSELLARAEIATEPATADTTVPVIVDAAALAVPATSETLVAVVPGHRRDIAIEADVAEEIARLSGYDAIAGILPSSATPPFRPDPRRFINELRELLSGRGLNEVLTHVLIAPEDHLRLGIAEGDSDTIRLANPVTADHSQMRRSLLPGMLGALIVNERRRRDEVAIFEIGPIHSYLAGMPAQADRLALLLAGSWQAPSWTQPARPVDLVDLKGVLAWLVERATRQSARFAPAEPIDGVEHPHRTADLLVGDEGSAVGRLGELDPRLLRSFDTNAAHVFFASIDVAALAAMVRPARVVQAGRPAVVERDIAVVVGEGTSHAEIEAIVRGAAGALLEALTLFDRYQGAPLGADEVSLAYRLQFQPAQEPLSDDDIEQMMSTIGAALRAGVGARIRGAERGS